MNYSYTIAQARDCMYSTFFQAWNNPTTGWRFVIPGIADNDPKAPKVVYDGEEPAADAPITQPEVYVFVRHADGKQASLRGENGRRWRRTGIILIRIYTPKNGSSLKTPDALTKVVLDAFQGKRGFGPGAGITFPRVRPVEQGAVKNRYLEDVLIDFEYDELI